EPSLFAVAKLLETGLVNLSRFEVLWRPVTAHLLEPRRTSTTRQYGYRNGHEEGNRGLASRRGNEMISVVVWKPGVRTYWHEACVPEVPWEWNSGTLGPGPTFPSSFLDAMFKAALFSFVWAEARGLLAFKQHAAGVGSQMSQRVAVMPAGSRCLRQGKFHPKPRGPNSTQIPLWRRGVPARRDERKGTVRAADPLGLRRNGGDLDP
ncbi:hypothetical protein BaRGS_00005117, partial [Batillaria attramentaria]